MQTKRTVDGARTPQSPESTLITLPAVARRATARRSSDRRTTAGERQDDVEGRIVEYLKDHPPSTIGDVSKGQEAD
jgi:hypothetical protein